MFVNSDLCIYGKVWREYLSIYLLSLSPAHTLPPLADIPTAHYLYMPSISSPHALYTTCSVIHGCILMWLYIGAYRALQWLIAIYLYYTIILYVLLEYLHYFLFI